MAKITDISTHKDYKPVYRDTSKERRRYLQRKYNLDIARMAERAAFGQPCFESDNPTDPGR